MEADMTALRKLEMTLTSADGLVETLLRAVITTIHTVKRKREKAVERFRASEARLWEKILDTTFLREELFAEANLWSFLRALLGAVLWALIAYEAPLFVTLPLLVFAILTDRIDGAVARMEGETVLGEIIDPWCDKVFAAMLFFAFAPVIWGPVFATLLAVEGALALGPFFVIFSKKATWIPSDASARSNRWGKTKFFLECTGLILLALSAPTIGNYVLAVAIPFAVMSAVRKVSDVFHTPQVL